MTKSLLLCFALCFGLISFAGAKKSPYSADEMIDKERKIEEIASNISRTVDVVFPRPKIEVVNAKIDPDDIFSLASFDPRDNVIRIGAEFFDFCMESGESAFAVVLAHEIGHYFNAHKSYVSVSGYYFPEERRAELKDFSSDHGSALAEPELQADLFAAFACYSAGYEIEKAWPEILERIYSLGSSNTHRNMSLGERKEIARIARNEIERLRPLHDFAVGLYVIGEFEFAFEIYDYLLSKNLTFPEIYANAGMCAARAACSALDRELVLPLSLADDFLPRNEPLAAKENTGTRSLSDPRADPSDFAAAMIARSLLKFENLAVKFPEMQSPIIALSSLYYLDGDYSKARNYAIRAEELAKTEFEKKLAICAKGSAFSGIDTAAAIAEFRKAEGFPIADFNLALLTGRKLPEKSQKIDEVYYTNENVAGIDPLNYRRVLESLNSEELEFPELENLKLKVYDESEFVARIARNDAGGAFWICALNSYSGETPRGIKIGSPKADLIMTYGAPDAIRIVESRKHYVYEDLYVVFEETEGFVSGITVFYR